MTGIVFDSSVLIAILKQFVDILHVLSKANPQVHYLGTKFWMYLRPPSGHLREEDSAFLLWIL